MPTAEELKKAADEAAAAKAKEKEEADAKAAAEAAKKKEEETVVVPDTQRLMKDLIEKARKEEKDKLYPQQERLKSELDEERKTRALFEKRVKELEDKIKEADDSDAKKKQTVEQKLAEMDKLFRDEIATIKAQADQEKQELSARLEKERLDVVKAREVAKYKGEIIDEMVSGNSETEIAASALAAHERYKKIAKDAADKLIQKSGTPPPANPPTDQGGGGSDLDEAASKLRNKDNPYSVTKEFAEKHLEIRQTLLDKLGKRGR